MSSNQDSLSAVVLAAGKGTRMFSSLPKVLHTVCGISLIERTLRALAPLKLKEIVVVVGFEAELVKKEVLTVKEKLAIDIPITFALQDEQLGTGHAAQIAVKNLKAVSSTLLILPGDVPLLDSILLKDFLSQFENEQPTVSCMTTNLFDPTGYGRIIRDENGNVLAIIEDKDCSEDQRDISEINSAIYLAESSFLQPALEKLSPKNAQKEYYLTDIIAQATTQNKKVIAYCCPDEAKVSGANNRLELNELESHRRLEIAGQLMVAGVTLEDPMATYIDEDVKIAPDTYIGAGTRITGQCSIGTACRIEGETFIKSSTIGNGSSIMPFSYIDSAIIGSDCQIGPSAHLRPGTVLESKVKIGNFVETKNAVLKKGAKANHLTYLGDSEVGENANVGAGTITCNYDGVKKSKTTIGAGAFIGSNSALVAPVNIGAGSFVAAGSTITKDLPENSLGIARSKQANIVNWAKDRKKG